MKKTFILLGWFLAFFAIGYLTQPLLENLLAQKEKEPIKRIVVDRKPEDREQKNEPSPEPSEEDSASAFEGDETLVDSDNDEAWSDENGESVEDTLVVAAEKDANSYMPHESDPIEQAFEVEEETPEDPEQMKIPGVFDKRHNDAAKREIKNLSRAWEKRGKDSLVNDEFPPGMWKKPDAIRKNLESRVMEKLGNLSEAKLWEFMGSDSNRLDLARITMLRMASDEGIRNVAEQRMGGSLLSMLSSDLDWMTGLLYSGPSGDMARTLSGMARIFSKYSDDMTDPVVRRIATTTASEAVREGFSDKDMMERFEYYYSSYRANKLNVIFDNLRYWETRFVTGCLQPSNWGSPRSLAWQRDNVRLPAEQYLNACTQLVYRLRNVAGDSVFSSEYLAPVLKYTNNTTAWAHREIGGVCGACSHYGAYGALAVGIPATTMGEPGHCAYTVRIGDSWQKSYSIYWQHGLHKNFWREHDWDFLILTQRLYSDYYNTLVSDQLCALADFLVSRKKNTAALTTYHNALLAQPLNWPVWLRYTGFLKVKAPTDKAKWRELHDMVSDGLAPEFHNVAATLLRKYIYPCLLPLADDKKELNKMFDSFFRQCKDMGTNRWDIAPFLNSQIESYKTEAEQKAYMRDALRTLMARPAYAGAVLAWGLDFVASQGGDSEEANRKAEMFTDLLMAAMSRARTSKKEADATWAALGEAIYTAEENKDRRTFQAVGKLAYRKFKKRFPRKQIKFRAFPGRVVSTTGLITTATTVDPGQMTQCVMHWAVLQRGGGSIPGKFEGNAGVIVSLEHASKLNGVIMVCQKAVDRSRPFHMEISNDGQSWTKLPQAGAINGSLLMFDTRKLDVTTRHVRITREGDKYEPGITGFYVYGKPVKGE